MSTTYKRMPREVSRGDRILLGDGLIELRVLSTTSNSVLCRVVNGGLLGEHKGINLPGVKLRIPALTPKDHDDLVFALAAWSEFRRGELRRAARRTSCWPRRPWRARNRMCRSSPSWKSPRRSKIWTPFSAWPMA